MSSIDYKRYLLRVVGGVATAWIYEFFKISVVLEPLYYTLISTMIMSVGLVPVGYVARHRRHGFWRYSVTQIATHYIATIVFA